MPELSNRQKVVLAALAAKPNAVFAPVQVQKLFFLLDEKIAAELGGKQFDFEPYDYGPFDRHVYDELSTLARLGYVEVTSTDGASKRVYSLTPEGHEKGRKYFERQSSRAQKYMNELSGWIRSLSFRELVSAIYKEFPPMRARSVFKY